MLLAHPMPHIGLVGVVALTIIVALHCVQHYRQQADKVYAFRRGQVQCKELASGAQHFLCQPIQGRDEDPIEIAANPAQEHLSMLRRQPFYLGGEGI